MRPRAGHGWTWFTRGRKSIHLIANSEGHWVTTGEACKWPKCSRCRRPEDKMPFDSGLCVICYFYKTGLDIDEFWRLHNEGYPLAPYNIGKKSIANNFDRRALSDPKINWRQHLKTQGNR